ncbi:Coenzyme PQQ synthesis protein D (PqqD) [Sphingomonas guangdongensis]|uniref:Coenzyme PQQ synthesis protein D (PqqD) n=1 Tax=Sphingomonas guangdongensis TaxID=1141890 RepID=A0A285R216_9SPHN|nr:PqqD family protein [Sphingomonas guangdongensis]SOB88135.1 Coenzyme PQQ synthesis protein D (PqqD) [Sphingomonas guangdongensis]
MHDDLLVTRGDGLLEAEVDGELMGLHIERGQAYGFNPTATRIWGLIAAPQTVTQLCETLSAEYEIEPDEVRGDVLALLRDLEGEGLVTLTPA